MAAVTRQATAPSPFSRPCAVCLPQRPRPRGIRVQIHGTHTQGGIVFALLFCLPRHETRLSNGTCSQPPPLFRIGAGDWASSRSQRPTAAFTSRQRRSRPRRGAHVRVLYRTPGGLPQCAGPGSYAADVARFAPLSLASRARPRGRRPQRPAPPSGTGCAPRTAASPATGDAYPSSTSASLASCIRASASPLSNRPRASSTLCSRRTYSATACLAPAMSG